MSATSSTLAAGQSRSWTDLETLEGLELALAPAGRSTVVGKKFKVTIRTSDSEGVVPGVDVKLQIVKVGGRTIQKVVRTGPLGRARFAYKRSQPGEEQVVALVEIPQGDVTESMPHTWVPRLTLGSTARRRQT